MLEFLKELDTRLFLYLNCIHNDFFDSIFLWVTEKYSWLFLYFIILLLLIWRYMAVRVHFPPGEEFRTARFHINKRHWQWLLLAAVCVTLLVALGDQVSVHLFKDVFQRLRPGHEPELYDIVHLPGKRGGQFGFVSGHATGSFAVAYFTSKIIGLRWYTWVIFFWAIIFSYSRIYIGVHYPGDIIFGALLGFFVGWMMLRVWVAMGKEWFPSLLPGPLR